MLNTKFQAINLKNVFLLRAVNEICLPIKYHEGFYHTVATTYLDNSLLLTFNDIVIGGFSTRVETIPDDNHLELYILTIGVLPLFRRKGLGKLQVEKIEEMGRTVGCTHVFLHVHVLNEEALKFYEKVGFTVEKRLESYYKRLEKPDAFLLRKSLG